MNIDHGLVMGLILGVTVGLWYSAELTAYLPFFVIGALIYILRYIHAK